MIRGETVSPAPFMARPRTMAIEAVSRPTAVTRRKLDPAAMTVFAWLNTAISSGAKTKKMSAAKLAAAKAIPVAMYAPL